MSAGDVAVWAGLVDDAALFPPGLAPLPEALPAHAEHRRSWYGNVVGPFVLPVSRLDEITGYDGNGGPIDIALTLPGGPDALVPALRHFEKAEPSAWRLAAVEIVPPEGTRAGGLVRLLDDTVPPGVRVSLELPRSARRDSVVAALSGSGHQAKIRTGGTEAAAFPGERELAETIVACVGQGVRFKCTAGLHHAVRHRDSGFEHHGFLNVLLATAAATGGAAPDAVAEVLAERSPRQLLHNLGMLGEHGIGEARTWFTSFGSCSIIEPVDDLVALGLVAPPPPTDPRSPKRRP